MPRFWVTILILHTSTVFIFYWLSAKRLKHERIGGYVGIQGIGVIARLKGVEGLNLGRSWILGGGGGMYWIFGEVRGMGWILGEGWGMEWIFEEGCRMDWISGGGWGCLGSWQKGVRWILDLERIGRG